jgi:coenzyme Q-binding protein COQ10
MPVFRTTKTVAHAPADMFELVADVEQYPQFLPLCTGLKIRKRGQTPEGLEQLTADMEVGYKAIREKFTSRVTLDRPNLKILVEYVDGPFSHMQNSWTFLPSPAGRGGGCLIEFFIDYAFKSRTLSFLMGSMFETAFRRFTAAFEKRADVVYGSKSTKS